VTRVWAIAANTLREAIRNRILYALLFFAMVPIASSSLLGHLTVGEFHKIVVDVGLAAITIFGTLIAIFVGIGLVNREIERKTIYTIASKPIPRGAFVLGKYVGLVALLVLLVVLMGAAQTLAMVLSHVPVEAGFFTGLLTIVAELMVVTAFAVLFSTFTRSTLASFFSLSMVVIGHLSSDIRDFGGASEVVFIQKTSALVFWLLPNLEAFNVRSEIVHGVALPPEFIGLILGYGALYSAVVLAASVVVFHFRDF